MNIDRRMLILFVLLANVVAAQEPPAVTEAIQNLCVIKTVFGDGTMAFSTGTFLETAADEAWVLTCGHHFTTNGFRAGTPCEVSFLNGEVIPGHLNGINSLFDVGLVELDHKPNLSGVKLAQSNPQLQDYVFLVGCAGDDHRYKDGEAPITVSAATVLRVRERIELDCPGKQGMSGGPTFNKRGELVGTLVGAWADRLEETIVVRNDQVREFTAPLYQQCVNCPPPQEQGRRLFDPPLIPRRRNARNNPPPAQQYPMAPAPMPSVNWPMPDAPAIGGLQSELVAINKKVTDNAGQILTIAGKLNVVQQQADQASQLVESLDTSQFVRRAELPDYGQFVTRAEVGNQFAKKGDLGQFVTQDQSQTNQSNWRAELENVKTNAIESAKDFAKAKVATVATNKLTEWGLGSVVAATAGGGLALSGPIGLALLFGLRFVGKRLGGGVARPFQPAAR